MLDGAASGAASAGIAARMEGQEAVDWQQQVEEAVALRAIFGDSFTLVAGLPPDVLDSDIPDPGELAAQGPVHGSRLECQLHVFVDVPVGFRLQVAAAPAQLPDSVDGAAVADEMTGPRVSHLPPVCLRLRFPADYPSAGMPAAQLSAPWLTPDSVQMLLDRLTELWHEQGPDMPVVYTWAEWLQTSALEALSYSASLPVPRIAAALQTAAAFQPEEVVDATSSSAAADPAQTAAEPGDRPWEMLLVQLLQYDASREYQLFQEGTWKCSVCFEEVLGRDCVRLECRHAFCMDCVAGYASMHVADGSVDRLTCLEPGCTAALPREALKRILSDEELDRLDTLTLQRTLDRMADLVYCPRCSVATIEDDSHFAQCTKCQFTFCSLCNAAYHPGRTCLSPEAQLEIVRARMQGTRQNEEELRRKEAEILNLAVIEETAKQCPTCGMAIERSEGCNKMTCTNCGAFFCYRCGKRIAGYDHFGDGSCVLFDPEEVARWQAMMRAMGEEIEVPFMAREARREGNGRRYNAREACPCCRRRNPKEQRNNHIRCWGCGRNYCYLCRANLTLEGVRHFSSVNMINRLPRCRQHTDD